MKLNKVLSMIHVRYCQRPRGAIGSCLICWMILFAMGCTSVPHGDCFTQSNVETDRSKWLERTLLKVGETPLWNTDTNRSSRDCVYRLIVLTSSPFLVAITVRKSESWDVFLTTKVISWKYKEPFRPEGTPIVSTRLEFNESRILAEDEWKDFESRYNNLCGGVVKSWSDKVNTFFSMSGGNSFVLESYEHGKYRLLQINNPNIVPISEDGKALLLEVFPDLNVTDLEEYAQRYLDLLGWFTDRTGLYILRVSVKKANVGQVLEDTLEQVPK